MADPDVDVVYVASPHALHLEHARLAFEAGKHVLCEKPLTLDARRGRGAGRAGAPRDLFLMEAMWMACHPLVRDAPAAARGRRLRHPAQVHADLGFVVDADRRPTGCSTRRWAPARCSTWGSTRSRSPT